MVRKLKNLKLAPASSAKIVISLILWVVIIYGGTRVLVKGDSRTLEPNVSQVAGEQVEEATGQATGEATPAGSGNSPQEPEQEGGPSSSPTPTASPSPVLATEDSLSSTTYGERLPERLYVGPAFAAAKNNKDLLVLNFDSSLAGGWTEELDEGTEEASGVVGKGLKLGQLKLADGEIFTYAGTLSFWLKMEAIPKTGEEQPLLIWNFNEEERAGFSVSFAKPQLIFSITDEEGNQEGVDPELKNPYDWHYVVATWDLTKEPFHMTLYIDGQKLAEGGFPFEPKLVQRPLFQLGGEFEGLSSATFSIDELVLTNWAKSEQEIVGGR